MISAIVSFNIGFAWWRISRAEYILTVCLEAYCWMDMVMSFRTGYVEAGHLIMDPKKISKHYLQFWFWVDLVANFPFEALVQGMTKQGRKGVKLFKWFKIPRLLRLGNLRKVLRGHARFLELVTSMSTLLF